MLAIKYFNEEREPAERLSLSEFDESFIAFDQSSTSAGFALFSRDSREAKQFHRLTACGIYTNESQISINAFRYEFLASMFNTFKNVNITSVIAEQMFVERESAARNLFYMEATTFDFARAIKQLKLESKLLDWLKATSSLDKDEKQAAYEDIATHKILNPYSSLLTFLSDIYAFNDEALAELTAIKESLDSQFSVKYKPIPVGVWRNALLYPETAIGTRDHQKKQVADFVLSRMSAYDLSHPNINGTKVYDLLEAIGIGMAVRNGIANGLPEGTVKNRQINKSINVTVEYVYDYPENIDAAYLTKLKNKVISNLYASKSVINVDYEYGVDIDDQMRRALEFESGLGMLVIPERFSGKLLFSQKRKPEAGKSLIAFGLRRA